MTPIHHLFYFDVEERGRVVGEVVVKDVPPRLRRAVPMLADECYYLHRLWVAARYRRNGLAHKLMTRVAGWADATGTSLCLCVRPFSPTGPDEVALRVFYERYGFKMLRKPDLMVRFTTRRA